MAARPAVALVLHRWDASAGGLEAWTGDLARHLLARGYPVHVVATLFVPDASGIQAHPVEPSASPLTLAERIERTLRQVGADLVHDTGSGWSGHVFQPQTGSRLLCQEAELRALPPVERLRHALSPHARRWRRELAEVEQRQVANAQRIVAVSRFVAAGLTARYGVPEARMTLIPNGVDTARFRPFDNPAQRATHRAALGIGPGILFAMVANNFRLKGVATALAALRRLRGEPVRLVIAGAGDIPGYRRLAERLGIADRVSFLGHVDHVPGLLAAADVFLQPTRYDACSLTTLEALACGLPVITTRANGASELMSDGIDGFVLPRADDAAALAAAMAKLLPPRSRLAMAAAARRTALTQQANLGFARIETLYDDLLAGGENASAT